MLGGMTTLMGSSTNLIGAGIVTDFNIKPIGLLDMSIPALIIAIPSLIFTLLLFQNYYLNNNLLKTLLQEMLDSF